MLSLFSSGELKHQRNGSACGYGRKMYSFSFPTSLLYCNLQIVSAHLDQEMEVSGYSMYT